MINEPAFFSALFALVMCSGIALAGNREYVTTARVAFLIAHLSTIIGLVGILVCVFWPVVGVLVGNSSKKTAALSESGSCAL